MTLDLWVITSELEGYPSNSFVTTTGLKSLTECSEILKCIATYIIMNNVNTYTFNIEQGSTELNTIYM